jgi:hypothetical protein
MARRERLMGRRDTNIAPAFAAPVAAQPRLTSKVDDFAGNKPRPIALGEVRQIEMVALSSLKDAKRNARTHSKSKFSKLPIL